MPLTYSQPLNVLLLVVDEKYIHDAIEWYFLHSQRSAKGFFCGIDKKKRFKNEQKSRKQWKWSGLSLSLSYISLLCCHITIKYMRRRREHYYYSFVFVILGATIKFTYGMALVTTQDFRHDPEYRKGVCALPCTRMWFALRLWLKFDRNERDNVSHSGTHISHYIASCECFSFCVFFLL